MIRARPSVEAPISRRRALRAGFLAVGGLLAAEAALAVAPFLRVRRVMGLGTPVTVGTREEVLAAFASTDDRPILFTQGRFFLLHPPGGIIAAYRKCTHLGCAVPWDARNDRFTCPCHGSRFDKRTAVVTRTPAPQPLSLFHIAEVRGELVVDTNPLNVIERPDNVWDPAVIEVAG